MWREEDGENVEEVTAEGEDEQERREAFTRFPRELCIKNKNIDQNIAKKAKKGTERTHVHPYLWHTTRQIKRRTYPR